jgi:hypothetical protein
MKNKHENISVGVYWGDVGVPAESCQGDRTQGQQSVLKIAKSTVEVHSVWHGIYIATETGGQMRAVVYYSVRLRKSDRERTRDLRRDAQILPQ